MFTGAYVPRPARRGTTRAGGLRPGRAVKAVPRRLTIGPSCSRDGGGSFHGGSGRTWRARGHHRRAAVGEPGVRTTGGGPQAGPLERSGRVRTGRRGPRAVLGRAGRAPRLVPAMGPGHGMEPALGQVVP